MVKFAQNPEIDVTLSDDSFSAFDGAASDQRIQALIENRAEEERRPEPKDDFTDVLENTAACFDLINQLAPYIDPLRRHPLSIKAKKTKGEETELPIGVQDFQGAAVTVGIDPFINEDGRVFRDVRWGYVASDGYRDFGRLDFVVLSDEGKVIEYGSRSQEALDIFNEHLLGVELTDEEVSKLREINERIIEFLRTDPNTQVSQQKLEDFANKRGFESSWVDFAKLAHLDPRDVDLGKWARINGYTPREMYLAGWYGMSISGECVVNYSPDMDNVVLIPFKNEKGEIVGKRTRQNEPKPGAPKYRSDPELRAYDRKTTIYNELFFADLLKECEGKDLVLTEGEFKCLVSYKLTGVVTVGILGITQVSDTIADAIAAAKPRRVVIILDRDPLGAALMRVDGVTDSSRAAYLISRRLERAGVDDVRINSLPNVKDGRKVGLDDFLQEMTAREKDPKAELRKLIDNAMTPEEYLSRMGMSLELQTLFERRQAVNAALQQYFRTEKRGGKRLAPEQREPSFDVEKFEADLFRRFDVLGSGLWDLLRQGMDESARLIGGEAPEEIVFQLREMQTELEREFKRYLKEIVGARRINQPSTEQSRLYSVQAVRDSNSKILRTRSGEVLGVTCANGDVLMPLCMPSDLDSKHTGVDEGIKLPFSMHDLNIAKQQGKSSVALREMILEGADALGVTQGAESKSAFMEVRKLSFRSFAYCALAGYMQRIFPSDDYAFESDVSLLFCSDDYWHEATETPLMVFSKKSRRLVAIPTMPIKEFNLHDPKTWQLHVASVADSRDRMKIRAFFRSPSLEYQQEKLAEIIEVMRETVFNRVLHRTSALLGRLGISQEVVSERCLMAMTPEDFWSLRNEFLKSRKEGGALLAQAAQAGLYGETEDGYIIPRFEETVVLIPDYESEGKCAGFRVIPTNIADHFSHALPPTARLGFTLGITRELRPGDPSNALFHSRNLESAKGKTLLIAQNELDALILESWVKTRRDSEFTAVGLSGTYRLSEESIAALQQARAKRVIAFIHPAQSRLYDDILPEDMPEYLRDVNDLAARISSLDGVVLQNPLATVSMWAGNSDRFLDEILEKAVPIREYLTEAWDFRPSFHAEPLVPLSRGIENLERYLQAPHTQWIGSERNLPRYLMKLEKRYKGFHTNASQAGFNVPPSLEDLLAARWKVSLEDVERILNQAEPMPIGRDTLRPFFYSNPETREVREGSRWFRLKGQLETIFGESLSGYGARSVFEKKAAELSEVLTIQRNGEQAVKEKSIPALDVFLRLHKQELTVDGKYLFSPPKEVPIDSRKYKRYESTVSICVAGETIECRGKGGSKLASKHAAAKELLKKLMDLIN